MDPRDELRDPRSPHVLCFRHHMNRFFEDEGWKRPWCVADRLLEEPQQPEGETMEEEKKDGAVAAPIQPSFRHPLVDVHDGDDKITIEAELPGVKKEDIHIHIKGNVLGLWRKKTRAQGR
jgi:HSP20 family molecular chaperone IbpA